MDVSAQLNELDQKYKNLNPDRLVPLEFELRFLSALDVEPIADWSKDGINKRAQESTQLLINSLFSLPLKRVEDAVYAQLPARPNTLPRSKPVPARKALTRWEKFAAAKGIQKKRKTRVQFDEATDSYRPTFGYKNQGNKDADLTDWIKEVPANADQTVDLYEHQKNEKKSRIEKNKMQQVRNLEESEASKKGLAHDAFKKGRKDILVQKILHSKVSTASMGKFDKKLDNDDTKPKRGKRKFEPNTIASAAEKSKLMEIASSIGIEGKSSEVNVRKAIKHVKQEDMRSASRPSGGGKKKFNKGKVGR